MTVPRKHTKKHAFYNALLRYFRDKKISYLSINNSSLTATSGYLDRIWFYPYGNRIKVVKCLTSNDVPTVSQSFDFEINGSFETLFYKMYSFNLLSEVSYSKLLVDRYAKAS